MIVNFKICTVCYDSNVMNGAIFIKTYISKKLKLGSSICTKCYIDHINKNPDLNLISNIEEVIGP
jgi:hypothetical protein